MSKLRLKAGAREYGDSSALRHTLDILDEIEQEFLDIPGWGAISSRRFDLCAAEREDPEDPVSPPPSRSHDAFLRRVRKYLREIEEDHDAHTPLLDGLSDEGIHDAIRDHLASIAAEAGHLWFHMKRLRSYVERHAARGANL